MRRFSPRGSALRPLFAIGHAVGSALHMDDVTAEKIARNNSIFRDANEQITGAAAEHGLTEVRPVPLICECSDPHCTQLLKITLADYRLVRSDPRHFVHAPGHELAIEGAVRTVEERDEFVIVEKIGRAGEIAANLADGDSPN